MYEMISLYTVKNQRFFIVRKKRFVMTTTFGAPYKFRKIVVIYERKVLFFNIHRVLTGCPLRGGG
jgi:hypothetical protein